MGHVEAANSENHANFKKLLVALMSETSIEYQNHCKKIRGSTLNGDRTYITSQTKFSSQEQLFLTEIFSPATRLPKETNRFQATKDKMASLIYKK